MVKLDREERLGLARRVASRLKFPYLFFLVGVLFFLDMMFPDPIPFVDEIFLGFLTVLLGTWKERREEKERSGSRG